jgi:hypothetical protein
MGLCIHSADRAHLSGLLSLKDVSQTSSSLRSTASEISNFRKIIAEIGRNLQDAETRVHSTRHAVSLLTRQDSAAHGCTNVE